MSHELLEFISPLCSPELADVLSDLDDVLLKFQFNGHDDELQQLYNIAESRDREMLLDDVCLILKTGAYKVLRGIGVELSDEAGFQTILTITEALLGFEGADDYEHLLNILEYDMAPDEILCEVLEARTDMTVEDIMVVLTKVDPKIIERMRKVLRSYEQSMEEARDTKDILQRLNLYHSDNQQSLTMEALSCGIGPGISMEDLYQVFEEELSNRPVATAVKDLIGLSILAGVSNESIGDEIQYFMEDLYPSLEDRMAANKCLKQELDHYQNLIREFEPSC